jgi:hypothetical protein
MTTADTVAAQDVQSKVAYDNMLMEQYNSRAVCHPNARITAMYNTEDHVSYEKSVSMCAPEGVNADTCETGWGKNRCQWGIPAELGPLKPAKVLAKLKAIKRCIVAHDKWNPNNSQYDIKQRARGRRECRALREGSRWYGCVDKFGRVCDNPADAAY